MTEGQEAYEQAPDPGPIAGFVAVGDVPYPDREGSNDLWWGLVEKLQRVNRPPGRDEDEPDWAAEIHVALAPVYYHNYVLGNLLTAARLRRHLEKHVVVSGPFYEHEMAGRYLQ